MLAVRAGTGAISPLYDVLFFAPRFTGVRISYFLIEEGEFTETLVDLLFERRLFFQNSAYLPLEAGNLTPHQFQVCGDLPDLGNAFPKEFIRFQFLQLVESDTDVLQCIEPRPVNGKPLDFRFYEAQRSRERLVLSVDVLDLFVKVRQFLF